jgi:hypothetical protein
MRNIIKRHVQYLVEEQAYYLRLRTIEPPGTMFSAILDLSIAFQALKIEIWCAIAGVGDDERLQNH